MRSFTIVKTRWYYRQHTHIHTHTPALTYTCTQLLAYMSCARRYFHCNVASRCKSKCNRGACVPIAVFGRDSRVGRVGSGRSYLSKSRASLPIPFRTEIKLSRLQKMPRIDPIRDKWSFSGFTGQRVHPSRSIAGKSCVERAPPRRPSRAIENTSNAREKHFYICLIES